MVQRAKFKVAYQDESFRQKWGVFVSKPQGFGQSGYSLVQSYDNKSKAVKKARTMAKNHHMPSKLLVEKMNGRLSESSDYKPAEGEYYR